jgi:hypothetical protein
MSAYYAPPVGVPPTATEQQALAPVLVAFAGPAPQSRLTVLVRIFMVIPQLIVVGLLGIAACVLTIIGWFGALFTGRLPAFAADFLTGYLRWQARVVAYAFLLTDEYPPFSLDDADYPVRIAVQPGQLNRLAVLFRIFLLIPCWLVQTIVYYGAFTIFQFVSWLIVLITGQMPDAVYRALAAVIRYQVRTLGFAMMLTSAYPAGLFGDPQGYGGQPGGRRGQGDAELSWRLILSAGARKLMVFFIVLGVLLIIGTSAIDAVAGSGAVNAVSTVNASDQVQADVPPVTNAIDNYAANVKACKGQLACVTSIDRKVAGTLNTFAGQLSAIKMPTAQARSADAALISAVSHTAKIYARLGAATSANQYINAAKASGLQQSLNQTNQAFANLGNALNM